MEAVVAECMWSRNIPGVLRKPVEIAVNLFDVPAGSPAPTYRIQVYCYNGSVFLGPTKKPKGVKCNVIFCSVYSLNLVSHQPWVLDTILLKRIFASFMQLMPSS